MEDAQKLIDEFLANGGQVNRVPDKNFRRSQFIAPKIKRREMLASLIERAKTMDTGG